MAIEMLETVLKSTSSFHEVTAVCPHQACQRGSVFKQLSVASCLYPDAPAMRYPTQDNVNVIVGQCVSCGGAVLAIASLVARIHNKLLYPTPQRKSDVPEDVEAHIAASFREAASILYLSPSAAATLARRCVQDILCARLGTNPKHRLELQIAEAQKASALTASTKTALDSVRHLGNWGAHSSQDKGCSVGVDERSQADMGVTLIDVDEDEAEYTLHVVERLFQELYVIPARDGEVEKLVAKRRGKTADSSTAE